MSYIVKGKPMPDCCYNCTHLDDSGDYPMCRITEEQRGYNFDTYENIMDHCPLSELPKTHGRLIDSDELIQKLRNYHPTITFMDKTYNLRAVVNDVEEIISKLPTIVAAEDK